MNFPETRDDAVVPRDKGADVLPPSSFLQSYAWTLDLPCLRLLPSSNSRPALPEELLGTVTSFDYTDPTPEDTPYAPPFHFGHVARTLNDGCLARIHGRMNACRLNLTGKRYTRTVEEEKSDFYLLGEIHSPPQYSLSEKATPSLQQDTCQLRVPFHNFTPLREEITNKKRMDRPQQLLEQLTLDCNGVSMSLQGTHRHYSRH